MSRNSPRKIRLQPFDQRWAETVLGWIASPNELFHWSAREDFPLIDTSVFDKWHSDFETSAYILLTQNKVVAYGEVWLDNTDGSAELGRLVVSPEHRRQGFGRLLIEQLISLTHQAGHRPIWVRVFPANAPALDCYQSAGFIRVSAAEEAAFNVAQRFQFNWMVHRT